MRLTNSNYTAGIGWLIFQFSDELQLIISTTAGFIAIQYESTADLGDRSVLLSSTVVT